MVEIKLSDSIGWVFPDNIKEVSLGEYLDFCRMSLVDMPSWFREMRESKDVVRRKEIEEELDKSVDMKVELLRYWGGVICVFAKGVGKTPQLSRKLIEGGSCEVDGKKIGFSLGIDNIRELWELIDGKDNIFYQYQKDKIGVKFEDGYRFDYKGVKFGIDSPYMRRSKLVEYVEGRFWSEVRDDKDRGIFGEALSKLVAVLVREVNEDGDLDDVLVGDFTEENVRIREKYFSDLDMSVVMDIGFFLLGRVNILKKDLKMPIESLRVLRGLVGLIK